MLAWVITEVQGNEVTKFLTAWKWVIHSGKGAPATFPKVSREEEQDSGRAGAVIGPRWWRIRARP